jgi:thiol-disulfide isomerase/thioredoxin
MSPRPALFVSSALLLAAALPAGAAPSRTPVSEKSLHREGEETLQALFRRELDEAKRAKRHVVLFFTADWCTPCKVFKELLDSEEAVRKAARKGHILFVDVDEWRGPAHSLVPGAYPDKLPLLVRVDETGRQVVSCFGSELGLLSPEWTAKNLERFIDGQKPLVPDYERDSAKQRALLEAQAARRAAKGAPAPAVTAEVRFRPRAGGPGPGRWSVHLVIRNHDQRRRWFAIPTRLGTDLPKSPRVASWEQVGFADHVRAHYHLFSGPPGEPAFAVLPVAGEGSVDLDQWPIEGPPDAAALTVFELDRVVLDGKALEFDKKVPYELRVEDASRTHVQAEPPAPSKLEIAVSKRHEARL